MIRRPSLWIGLVLLLTSLSGYAGGPPILTTSKVPEYFVVGRPETLVFVVRAFCCGHQPFVRKDPFLPPLAAASTTPLKRKNCHAALALQHKEQPVWLHAALDAEPRPEVYMSTR